MATQIMVTFTVTGEFDPEEITRRLGVQPTSTCRQGDQIQNTIMRRKHDCWKLSIGRENSIDLGTRIRGLLDLLRGRTADFAAVCAELSLVAEIACAVYVHGSQRPAMSLDPRTVAEIAELGAWIDIDLYVLGDDENNDADAAG